MDIFNAIGKAIQQAMLSVINLLPDSPFKLIDNSPVKDLLPYINFFIPFDFVIATLELWLSAITIYYIYSVVLRWVKAIN
jgi:hypothetical protein